jgi:dihydropyrimidinase
MSKQFDLVITNGVVVTSGDVGPLDIAIKDGKIAHLAASIPEDAGDRVIDAESVQGV